MRYSEMYTVTYLVRHIIRFPPIVCSANELPICLNAEGASAT